MDPKTPSKEKIIATGAGDKFCWASICSIKAIPLDKIPAYINSAASKDNTFKETYSNVSAGTEVNNAAARHWNVAIVIGKLKTLRNLDIKTIWKAQKNAPITTKESPNLTLKLSNSLNSKPPIKHIKTDGQTD